VFIWGETAVSVGGRDYTVRAFPLERGKICVTLITGKSHLVAERCGAWSGDAARPFEAQELRTGGMRIWFGVTTPRIVRISFTNRTGIDFSAWTSTQSQAPARVWIVALSPSTSPDTLSGYDHSGKLVARRTTQQVFG
jgi:hypothetical protein